ncbi:hypothetical protein Aph01nite_44630 [Acrocarpospora phusangensis]|uniref:Uncharacterized protein n=1 Tax=Acrocarpospora phusangensis TaxID=1070424 RepID=A0A919QCH5_9ACTN|nr:hypothetical protein [Acrocarpospora phusangensis]GIH26153.1 hypothetical protein Aph01nite_44630 [Acrocarpospora phusangensis]
MFGTRSELERLIEEAIDERTMATGIPTRVAAFPVPPPMPKAARRARFGPENSITK